MPRDYTTVRSLSEFNNCPLCGEELEVEEKVVGESLKVKVFCPKHKQLTFPHTGLQWSRE